MIILDFGSGNTCKNDILYIARMIDELKAVDTGKHQVIIKWQLFEKAGDNIPLDFSRFSFAYEYAKKHGYETTASVFDVKSLNYLLLFDVPFIKIANRPDLYWLAGEVPRKVPVYMSASGLSLQSEYFSDGDVVLNCVSKYPATAEEYVKIFGASSTWGLSDHTTDFKLYHKYNPKIYECHYKLSDSTGLDAGDFARMPEQLGEIL